MLVRRLPAREYSPILSNCVTGSANREETRDARMRRFSTTFRRLMRFTLLLRETTDGHGRMFSMSPGEISTESDGSEDHCNSKLKMFLVADSGLFWTSMRYGANLLDSIQARQ